MPNILELLPQGDHLLTLLKLYRASAVYALTETDHCVLLAKLAVIHVENGVISLVFVNTEVHQMIVLRLLSPFLF